LLSPAENTCNILQLLEFLEQPTPLPPPRLVKTQVHTALRPTLLYGQLKATLHAATRTKEPDTVPRSVPTTRSHEAGVTLIEVVIAAALLGIVVVTFSRSLVDVWHGRETITAKHSYLDVESDFKNSFWNVFQHNYITAAVNPCNAAHLNSDVQSFPVGTNASGTLDFSPDTPAGASQSYKSAAATCNKGKVSNNTRGFYYLCYDIKPTAGASIPHNTFLANQDILAQFQVQLLDLANNHPIKCADFVNTATAGARILVSLSWRKPGGTVAEDFQTEYSVQYAGK